MLSPSDVLVIPSGVRLEADALYDDVRQEAFELNPAGRDVVLNDGKPLADAVADICRRWQLPSEQAERDVLAFAWMLNRAFLANVRRAGSPAARLVQWLLLSIRLLPLGIAPPILNRRYEVDTSSLRRALGGTLTAAWKRCLLVSVGCLAGSLPLLVDANGTKAATWGAVGVTAGLGVACHEVGHVLALRRIPVALVVSGLALSVLYQTSSRRRTAVVGVCGPGLPALLAVVVMTIALWSGSAVGAMAACPFAAHALTATLAGRDGRMACRS
jgi:hypothetical protein